LCGQRLLRACALLAALPGVLGACASDRREGYAIATAPAFNISSVFVPVFRNRTLSTGTESLLTEALMKQLQARTGMRVVSSEALAQSVLRGEVTNVEMRRLSLDSTTGLVQEVALVVTVDYTWTDTQTGKVLVARKNFTSVDSFVPSRPTGEKLATGENAAVQRLAADIVDTMRGGW
jgi:hypothetical protein